MINLDRSDFRRFFAKKKEKSAGVLDWYVEHFFFFFRKKAPKYERTRARRDKIMIADLRVPTVIGVHAHERIAPQMLLITATVSVLLDKAAQTDAIADVLDYTQIRQAILDFAKQSHYQLLEAFTAHLADHLKKQCHLSWLQLSVTKFPTDMPDIRGVTLLIER